MGGPPCRWCSNEEKEGDLMNAIAWNRFQFGFTATYHYLFPQLTMGLALLIVLFKALALWKRDEVYNDAARFWARFSSFAGGVIGLTLAMEGMFAFFAESAFLGLFLFGEKRLGPKLHMLTA